MSADRDKTPMSQLKELKDKDKVFGANLSVDEINDPKNKSNEFEFACVFKQSYNGPEFKGTGTGKTKKAAKHAACQTVLNLLQNPSEMEKDYLASNCSPIISSKSPIKGSVSPIFLVRNHVDSPTIQQNLFNDGKTYVIQPDPTPCNSKRNNPQLTTLSVVNLQLDSPELLRTATSGEVIGDLQAFCAKRKLDLPKYADVHWAGPDNSNRFKVTCTVGDVSEYGVATVKINAKKIAAFKVLEITRSLSLTASKSILAAVASANRGIQNIEVNPPQTVPVGNANRPSTKVTEKIRYYDNIVIGRGATATVYEGRFENRPAAVKICHKEMVYNEKSQELNILRKLDNPHVVRYYITEDIGDLTYIVMELAKFTLEQVIEKNSMTIPAPLCKYWANDMTKGMLALHNQDIVHRDIKPSNVLIFLESAKLADFGISKELESSTQGVETEASRGTRIWMPTEVLKAIGSTHFFLLKSFDIFSLGLTIFYTMTQDKHLFAHKEKEAPFETLANIVSYQPNWGWLSNIEWTSLKNLLQAMIHLEPTKRPDAPMVLEHPFFWNDGKSLDFVTAVNNDFKSNPNSVVFAECKSEMMNMYERFCNEHKYFKIKNWKARLCPDLQNFITFQDRMRTAQKSSPIKKYSETSFMKLIEFIRDHSQHHEGWKSFENGKLMQDNIFGKDGINYGSYFVKRFPELTTFCMPFSKKSKTGICRFFHFINLTRVNAFQNGKNHVVMLLCKLKYLVPS